MKRAVYYIQPSYRKMDGKIVKGWVLFNASINLPILSAITPLHWEKRFCLEYFEDIDYDTPASVICLSSMGYDILHAVEIAREFKKRGKIVIFGCHQDTYSDKIMKGECDAVFYGIPDVRKMTDILEDAISGKLAAEYHCGIHIDYPFDYSVLKGRRLRHLPILASGGCKNNCDYCCYPIVYNGRYRLRHIHNVIEDLRAVRSQTRYAAFKDANIYNNRKYLLRLCDQMTAERIGLRWGAQSTIDIGDDPEALSMLRRAGCRMLFIGFETTNQDNLQSVGKPYIADQYYGRVKQIQKAGIRVVGYFIIGFDADTTETFREIYEFVHKSHIALPLLNILIPIPGTRVFDRLKQEGRIKIQDESEFVEQKPLYSVPCSRCHFIPKRISKSELEHGFVNLAKRLTTFREIFWRSFALNPIDALQILKMNLDLRKEYHRLATDN